MRPHPPLDSDVELRTLGAFMPSDSSTWDGGLINCHPAIGGLLCLTEEN